MAARTGAQPTSLWSISKGPSFSTGRDTIRSSGYVVHTLEAAIWSVARTGDFRGAVLLAANLADAADTVAAVTGQLAGALYGLNAIPDHWRERAAWKDRLLAAARRLLSEPLADR